MIKGSKTEIHNSKMLKNIECSDIETVINYPDLEVGNRLQNGTRGWDHGEKTLCERTFL